MATGHAEDRVRRVGLPEARQVNLDVAAVEAGGRDAAQIREPVGGDRQARDVVVASKRRLRMAAGRGRPEELRPVAVARIVSDVPEGDRTTVIGGEALQRVAGGQLLVAAEHDRPLRRRENAGCSHPRRLPEGGGVGVAAEHCGHRPAPQVEDAHLRLRIRLLLIGELAAVG